jgi:hypothetical protein
MEATPDDLATQMAWQLPVVSPQQDSLAVVMLARWMRLMARHGSASLEVITRQGQESWVLRWHNPAHRLSQLEAPTLAELYVRLHDT